MSILSSLNEFNIHIYEWSYWYNEVTIWQNITVPMAEFWVTVSTLYLS